MKYLIILCLGLAACGRSYNGYKGDQGDPAPYDPYAPVDLVNPCGQSPSGHDEIFLRLANGLLVASYSDNSNGNNTRFVLVTPGTYQTTDGDNCVFTVDSNNQIVNENHHY